MDYTDIKNLPKEKKIKLVGITIISLIVVIVTIIYVNYKNEAPEIRNKIILYNNAVLKYNEATEEYNNLLKSNTYEYFTDLPQVQEYDVYPEMFSFADYCAGTVRLNRISESLINLEKSTDLVKEAIVFLQQETALKEAVQTFNKFVVDYNTIAEEYQKTLSVTSIENIIGLPKEISSKELLPTEIKFGDYISNNSKLKMINEETTKLDSDIKEILYNLLVVQQITNPNEIWVKERLQQINSIVDIQTVSAKNDPNGMLNKEGGYTACIYFAVKQVDKNTVPGSNTIEKGTDAGGAIEVYKTADDAKNRCEYLSQFDNTLLYSGSYAILGTTVIRTSYLLSNEEQIDLTKQITSAFTAVI